MLQVLLGAPRAQVQDVMRLRGTSKPPGLVGARPGMPGEGNLGQKRKIFHSARHVNWELRDVITA